jgi:hypothetical protein
MNEYTYEQGLNLDLSSLDMILWMYKAIYGAKGSGNAWYLQFAQHNAKYTFKRCKLDSSIWYRYDEEKEAYDYLCQHTNDYISVGLNVEQVILNIKKPYNITETGPNPEMYLRINTDVLNDSSGWVLHSTKYLE